MVTYYTGQESRGSLGGVKLNNTIIKKETPFGNVIKLRLIRNKTITKRLEKLFLQPFLHITGNTNTQICICLKKHMKFMQLMLSYIGSLGKP